MNIMITGSSGFVGKVLVKKLKETGHVVFEYDIETDIRYVTTIPEMGVDVLIHLAGISTDKECKEDPQKCFDVNVVGTLNLVRIANQFLIKQFIFASSEWVYGDSEVEKDEGAFINTMTLGEYALSKHVSEVNLLQSYMKTNLPTTILRFGIVYGPREKNWSVVESLFNTIKSQDNVKVGSSKTGRNYIHVEDIVSGIIKSIGLTGYHIINLEGDKFITLEEIVHEASVILVKNIAIEEGLNVAPSIRKIKNIKAKLILGWKPEYDITRGLKTLLEEKSNET